MTSDEINILRCLSDGRWRTAVDVSIKSGVPEIRAQETLERLAREGRLNRERPCGVSIYRNAVAK